MVPSQLIELGQQALADVRIGVANGEPLVRCQLLASEFYEALKRALRAPELSPVERWAVMAAANQCLHAADASISPIEVNQPFSKLTLPTENYRIARGSSGRDVGCLTQATFA